MFGVGHPEKSLSSQKDYLSSIRDVLTLANDMGDETQGQWLTYVKLVHLPDRKGSLPQVTTSLIELLERFTPCSFYSGSL